MTTARYSSGDLHTYRAFYRASKHDGNAFLSLTIKYAARAEMRERSAGDLPAREALTDASRTLCFRRIYPPRAKTPERGFLF
jgi:hypothetical protein